MDIVISNTSGQPIYQQISEQLGAQILKGELPRGTMLPPIRTVAAELRVSVITVKKAWEALENQGLLNSMVGRGCFVADLKAADRKTLQHGLVDAKMKKDVAYYKSLGLSLQDVIDSLKKLYD